ncbi:MAG: hypothetical protein EBQ87_00955 [Planctomycetes bacterium]|nr:hypothetical protein [Planctomycetota bacterium]
MALLNLTGGMGEVEFKGGGEPVPNPGAAGGGGGAVIVPADGDKGIELPGNGGKPPLLSGCVEGGGGEIGAIAGTEGNPIGKGGATGAGGGVMGSGVPELGILGTPKGGGGVPIGAGGGGGAMAGIPDAGVLGSGGIASVDGGGGATGGATGGAIGGIVGVDPGKGGNSVLVFSPGKGGRPPLFPARSGTGGMGGTAGIVLGSPTGAPLFSSAVVSLISFPGTGNSSIFAGVTTGTIPSFVAVFFGSTAATAVSVAASFVGLGSMYFLIITAESSPTKDAVTTNPALVSRFIEPTPYKLGGQSVGRTGFAL